MFLVWGLGLLCFCGVGLLGISGFWVCFCFDVFGLVVVGV